MVKFDLFDAEKAAAFDELVAETVKSITENEPGTLVYAAHTVDGEPLARIFYEVYRDRAAFERSMNASRTPADSWTRAVNTSSRSVSSSWHRPQ